MRKLLLAVLALLLALSGPASARRRASDDDNLVPEKDDYNSMKMEAAAIRGEVNLHDGDLRDANNGFRDSLTESTRVELPHSGVMGLDLLRTAQLCARRRDYEGARRHLEILISRYPDSDWAREGRDLLARLPRAEGPRDDDDLGTPVVTSESPASYLGRMRSAIDSGDWSEAMDAARAFVDRYPTHRAANEVRLLAGAIYLRDGQAERAARILRGAAETGNDAQLRAKAVYLLGGALLAAGDPNGVLREVPAVSPAKSWNRWITLAQVWRAGALDKLGRGAEAARVYREVLAAREPSPLKAFAHAALAQQAAREGKNETALKGLKEAAAQAGRWRLDDLAAASQLSVGHVLYRLHRFDDAARAYGAFIRARPDDPLRTLALYQEGLSLKREGRSRDAVAAFSALVGRDPDSVYAADAHLQLGQLYGSLGEDQKAVEHYQDMAQARPSEATGGEADLLVAQVHYNAKRYAQAIPLYEGFLAAHPKDARAKEVEQLLLTSYWLGDRGNPGLLSAVERYPGHAIVARIRWELAADAYKKKDFGTAEGLFARFIADFPKSPKLADALFYEAESSRQVGDDVAAAGGYRRLLSRFPKDPRAEDARLNLALSLLKGGDKAAALNALEAFVKRHPAHPRASALWFEIAKLREGMKLPAAPAYERVSPSDPNRAAALFAAARLREKAHKTQDALRTYEALTRVKPYTDPARIRGLLRLAMMYELNGKSAKALPLYGDVMKHSARDSQDFEAARKRVEALTARGLLASGAAR